MFPVPWFVAVLVGIPNFYLVELLGFSLFNLRFEPKIMLLVASISALVCYVVRLFNTIDWAHTFVLCLFVIVLCTCITRINLFKVIAAILCGLTISIILEYTYLPLFLKLTASTFDDFAVNPWLDIYFFIPEAIIMSLLCWLVRRNHLYIMDGATRH